MTYETSLFIVNFTRSTVIYGALVVIEGSVSLRSFLYDDSLIAEKVRLIYFLIYLYDLVSYISLFFT